MSEKLKNILYAEDDESIREIAKIALEEVGDFTVQYCSNGSEVVEAAKKNHFIPDLILLDVMMPVMDGLTALKEIKKIPGFENIPIVLMTAKIQPNEMSNYKLIGASDVIVKPFDPMALPTTLNNIWNQHKGKTP